MDAQWARDQAFLARANSDGAAIFGLYRNHPMVRPFNFRRGTSLFKGVEDWRDLGSMTETARLELIRDPRVTSAASVGLGPSDHGPCKGRDHPAAPDGHRLRQDFDGSRCDG